MFEDEEEKRKERLNDINRLFGNTNLNNNVSNDATSYEERINNVNRLFNIDTSNDFSISNSNIKRDELQEFLKSQNDSTDYNNNVPTVETVVAENESLKPKGNDEKEEKTKINTSPTVNSSNASFREQNKSSNFFKVDSSNTKVASQKEQESMKVADDTDIYVLSNGEVDYRNNTEKTIDSIKGVSGNLVEGINDFLPSVIDYINAGEKLAAKNTIKGGLKLLGYSDEEVERIADVAMQNYNNMSPISQLNYLLNNENKQQERNDRINRNTLLASSSPVAKKLAELAPSIGDNVISMGLTAVNPVLGTASFILSAGGSYLDDARARGMNDDQAFGYATVMGIFEGGTESLISGSMVDKIGRKFFGKGLTDEVLNSFGVSATENFFQEALMEPLQETAATIFGGKEAANWEDMGQRFFESGVDGVLSAIILGGASVGIASAENVVNKANPTGNDYNKAIVDTLNSGKVDVKGIIEGAQQAIIANENMQTFYTATLNQDGSVENVQAVRGKIIENPNKKVKVTPVIIKNQENSYNIIDRNTGLLLDSFPYQTLIEAQASFDNKIINLDEATVNNINSKIVQTDIAINQEISKVQSEMNADRNIKSDYENVMNIAQSRSNNVNAYSNIDTDTNSNTEINTNVDTNNVYQTPQNQFTDNKGNNTQNYISNPNTAVNNQNNGLADVTNLVTRISDNAIYNKEETDNIFRFVAKSISNIELQVNDNTTYINSLDRNGNVSSQQQIPNRKMSGGEIRDIINNAINNADLSNINNVQTSQNQFRDTLSNEMTNYTPRRSNKNVGQNNKSAQQNSSKNKNTTARTFVEQINNYKKKSVQYNKIIGGIVEININIFENISKRKQSSFLNEYLKNEVKGHDYYIGGQKIIANGTTIGKLKNGHTNFDKRIDTNIRNELKANIIGNLKQVISISGIYQANKQDTKNHTFADTFDRRKALVKYNDQNYEVMFEIGKKNNVNTLYGIENIKRTNKNRLSLPKLASKKGLQNTNKVVDGSHKSSKSITQTEKNVKSNTSTTNKSMPNNKNNASRGEIKEKPTKDEIIDNIYENVPHRTSKDNQKNNKRIENYLQLTYPDYEISFTNFKADGAVIIHKIETKGEARKQRNQNSTKDSKTNQEHKEFLRKNTPVNKSDEYHLTYNKLPTEQEYKILDNIKERINKLTEKLAEENIDTIVEESHSSADAIYIDVLNDKNEIIDTLRIANHYKNGVSGNYENNIDLSEYSSKKALLNDIEKTIKTINKKTIIKDNGIRAERTSNRTNKTLIAQHNTSEEKLSEALELGALPVPSIAITKYQNPVLKYGDITLLFNRDTINPTDRRNVTYNSDIYSTRKPEIGIALDKQKLKSFEKMATEKGIGYGYLSMIEEYVEQNELSRARELIQNELEKNNDNVNAQDVENVYTELLESIQEKRIMKPGVDPYTPSGNRKSLIQRSIPYTLDNIVKIMTQKSTKGSESNSFAGLPEIRANLAQNFRSIESMHQNENNLITSEEMVVVPYFILI